MSHQLLVPIKSRDRIEDLLPYLEDIARPEMTIVFLVHLGVNRFAQLTAQLLEVQSGLPANFSTDTSVAQSNLTHRIEHIGRELRNRGVRIKVKFYSGRLLPILRQHSIRDGRKLVIMRPGMSFVRRWVRSLLAALQLAKPSPAMPVLLSHLSHVARRPL